MLLALPRYNLLGTRASQITPAVAKGLWRTGRDERGTYYFPSASFNGSLLALPHADATSMATSWDERGNILFLKPL